MKTLLFIFIVLISINSSADFASIVSAQYMHKDKCLDSRIVSMQFNYVIVQKLDKHHYELVGVLNGMDLRAVLETTKATFNGKGRPAGISMKYMGAKDMPTNDGFSRSIDQWKECKE